MHTFRTPTAVLVALVFFVGLANAAPPNLTLEWTGVAADINASELCLSCQGQEICGVASPVALTDSSGVYVLGSPPVADGDSCFLFGRNAYGDGSPQNTLVFAPPGPAFTVTIVSP